MSASTELWTARAQGSARDQIDLLRKVLDPTDAGGVKNTYIDRFLKHYLVSHLRPELQDIVLEVGCGTGRLVEYLAPLVAAAYGTDLIDDFVAACGAAPGKAMNSHYLYRSELSTLRARINKLYIVWVLMCVDTDDAVVDLLDGYRQRLPSLTSVVIIEQVKTVAENELLASKFYCRYRTIDGYRDLFWRAGFRVRSHTVMAERRNGLTYRALRLGYRLLPRRLARLGPVMFAADRRLNMWRGRSSRVAPSQRFATDVAFELTVR